MPESQKNIIKPSSMVEVPFMGKGIVAGATDGGYLVSLRRVCENMGIQFQAQLKRLKRQPWAVVSIMDTTGSDGKTYEMSMVDRRTFLMWLATIDTNRVKNPKARKAIIEYQLKASEVLDEHFGTDVDKALQQAQKQLRRQKGAVAVVKAIGLSASTITFTELGTILYQAGYRTGKQLIVKQLVRDGYLYRFPSHNGKKGKAFPFKKYVNVLFTLGAQPVKQSDGNTNTFTGTRVLSSRIPFFVNDYAPKHLEALK